MASRLSVIDYAPPTADFRSDVINGLNQTQKSIPCKYLYDERGSALFDQICETDEYYPTRTELVIMERYGPAMAQALGPKCVLIEFGSGSSLKTHLLLEHMQEIAAYIPVDISKEHLEQTAIDLDKQYPQLKVVPVCADFTEPFELPEIDEQVRCRVVYFPGSTIGNLNPPAAMALLKNIAHLVGSSGRLLIGIDRKKDVQVLDAAYNDAAGVTAAFTCNIMERMNRELDADFQTDQYEHYAYYNEEAGRIEIYLRSLCEQVVSIADEEFTIAEGELIHVEHSYKYHIEEFAQLAQQAGFQIEDVWSDDREYFSVLLLIA